MDLRREPVFEREGSKSAPTLSEYAQKNQMSEDKVWELIEDGQVAARYINDSVLIFQEPGFEPEPALSPEIEQGIDALFSDFVPGPAVSNPSPAPSRPAPAKTRAPEALGAQALKTRAPEAQAPAAARDELPPVKTQEPKKAEEIRSPEKPSNSTGPLPKVSLNPQEPEDFAKFARDALERATELSRQLLKAKDELIKSKEDRIWALSEQLMQRDKEIRVLKRQIEDLETLQRFEAPGRRD